MILVVILFAMTLINLDFILVSFFAVLVSAYFAVSELKNNRLRQFHWREDGSWIICQGAQGDMELAQTQLIQARLLPGSVVTTRFALLNFRFENSPNPQKAAILAFSLRSVALFFTLFFSSISCWFKPENRKYLSVLLFKDNVDREKFRQLRVRVKVEGIKNAAHDTL
ncbi:hypothetical protein MNBD_GAMMA11-3018 [hydrothermal vent metagenome]|uniref:Uncharacterized protein n=1 Tax=hydrothermal vent metagenome TaxID=652676 RepID=A0A3B0Y3K4_9ZZZZ